MKPKKLTLERAKELLEYDPETGVMRWAQDRSIAVKKGQIAGTKGNGYRQLIVEGARLRGHRIAWLMVYGVWPKGDIDHINGVRDDNRIANLRDVTRSVNVQNQRRPQVHGKSGFLGVSWNKNARKWSATIRIGGRSRHLGLFVTAEEAYQAYLNKKREAHEGCTI